MRFKVPANTPNEDYSGTDDVASGAGWYDLILADSDTWFLLTWEQVYAQNRPTVSVQVAVDSSGSIANSRMGDYFPHRYRQNYIWVFVPAGNTMFVRHNRTTDLPVRYKGYTDLANFGPPVHFE